MSEINDTPVAIGFVGLGAMGFGMASSLAKQPNYLVRGYDIYGPSMERFSSHGGHVGESPRDVARESRFFICMAANETQVDKVLFDGRTGALQALPLNAIVIICSTVIYSYHETLPSRFSQAGRGDVQVVDCPVSGGTVRAAEGTLTIFASGPQDALDKADSLLRSMSEKLYVVPGGVGTASKVKMINQLMVGTHIAAAAEAMALATKAGLDTREVYDIIISAAGNSWAFENRVPHMLDQDWTPHSALDIFVKDMGIVVSTARAVQFPLPLASAVEQLYILGSSQGLGKEDDAGLIRIFLPEKEDAIQKARSHGGKSDILDPASSQLQVSKIGMIGLGAMGDGMAASLLRGGYFVHGYDISSKAVDRFLAHPGKKRVAKTPAEAVKDAEIVIIMVQNASQVEDVLFGAGAASNSLADGAVIILSSTVPPKFVRSLQQRLDGLQKGLVLVDAPVSGGVVRAADGNLTIICSGPGPVISRIYNLLLAMTGTSANLRYVQGGVGAASSVKCVNQLLAGVHIAAAAEGMAFAARLGLDPRSVFEFVSNSAAWSWMLANRVPQMLSGDWTPYSALAIFVKDLGIVLDEAKRLSCFCPVSSAAHTLYLASAAHGIAHEADAGVVRLWEVLAGVSVTDCAAKESKVSASSQHRPSHPRGTVPENIPVQQALDSLPPENKTDSLSSIQNTINKGAMPVLVVLDDDPTGTQTCHNIDVLVVWDDATLDAEFRLDPNGFFILTNSRALAPTAAYGLLVEICNQVKVAARRANKTVEIVLRGDSTLRGHLLEETRAAEEVMGPFDGWVISPFFYQGGRYTIDDIHYVVEGDTLVPVGLTPFAEDATFGYQNSNLRKYVMEKCPSQFDESSFLSITIQDIRLGGPQAVTRKLLEAPSGSKSVIVVNAAAESDMHVFVAGLLGATQAGKRYLYRTGAAFVSSRLGIPEIEPLGLRDLVTSSPQSTLSNTGGLIIAGSYVPKTTVQLKALCDSRGQNLAIIELDVGAMLAAPDQGVAVARRAAEEASRRLVNGEDVLVMTSRTLIKGHDALRSLKIGSRVAQALVQIVHGITVRPRYLIAKGGITSSDAATKGLGMRRAIILGQAAPGVPIWRCDEETSRYPGIPYVVFPGNVGNEMTLADLVTAWSSDNIL